MRQKDETDNLNLYTTVVIVEKEPFTLNGNTYVPPDGTAIEVEIRFALDLVENAIENNDPLGELPTKLDEAFATIRDYLNDPDAWTHDYDERVIGKENVYKSSAEEDHNV
jgi:hypothetical protein